MSLEKSDELKELISAARGEEKADLVLKNAKVLNVFTGELEECDVAIRNGYIAGLGSYEGFAEIDLEGKIVCPGLIDGHIHIESSMLAPSEFAKAVLPHGTTAVICDPHEIANVAGAEGLSFMLESSKDLPLEVFFMLPSCVPATPLDEAGAELNAASLNSFYANIRVLGLAELMNSYGTVRNDREIISKILGAQDHERLIDGHAPGLSGHDLNAYVAAGVESDHECSTAEEAIEKLKRGQWIMIREGTAAKNLNALLPLFDDKYCDRCMLVTDDKHPGDLIELGHIDYIIREAIKAGKNPANAIKMASFNAA
ncbi:MAG: adenine deaminase, partial [Lachnospiraceae bacterium]|nr:adenine deaminase [Lachnospiraceae bacterium]